MIQRGLSLNLAVALSLDGGDLIYFALNCTTKDKIPPGGDARAARVLAIPFLRPRTRADGINPHLDEYYRLSTRMPLWIDRASLAWAETRRAFLPRLFRHRPSTYQKLRVSLNFGTFPEAWFLAGVFPLEKSDNDCIVMNPWDCRLGEADRSQSKCHCMVHFASSSTERGGFVVILDFVGVEDIEYFESPTTTFLASPV